MDAFGLRGQVVGDYSAYIQSFLTILDPQIREFVDSRLAEGLLWPDPLIQLSPAYQAAETIDELARAGIVHPTTAALFRARGSSLRLHHHQRSALDLAAQGAHYVVTTGTGSGKSLTFLLPIVDHVLRNQPARGGVRAIIVYPMNALINSQEESLKRYAANLPHETPITFRRYTGQERDAEKAEIRANPPHILLTNYVMLELMLTRPEEHVFLESVGTALQFLVLDELHTYRGRQGADVGLLVRRLRERCGNPHLQCIGTSATMARGDTRAARNTAVAAIASKLFGVTIDPAHVIDETLRWSVPTSTIPDGSALRSAILAPQHASTWEAFGANPLAAWIESTYGLRDDGDGRLSRRDPITLAEGADELVNLTGLAHNLVVHRLVDLFRTGSQLRNAATGEVGFAFKLHQFFSQGGAVYATIDDPTTRFLTLDGQHYAPPAATTADEPVALLYPLVFCRVCGQDYALCAYDDANDAIVPRPPLSSSEDTPGAGYLALDPDGFWPDDATELLPEFWFDARKSGPRIKRDYAAFVPRRMFVAADGTVSDVPAPAHTRSWYVPAPFLTCLRCGEVYSKRQSDFGKLARLSSEGRSTATTLLALSAIMQLRADTDVPAQAQKLLSFTDNRQDASLQAGHFNDFVSAALLRAALARAVAAQPAGIDHSAIAQATVAALNLQPVDYLSEKLATADRSVQRALTELIEYRIYADLRRGWRVTQPNLEQCGLLLVDYADLAPLCDDDAAWQHHAILAAATPATRLQVARALLDYMRRELAISAECLTDERQEMLLRRVADTLKQPWAFDQHERLLQATRFVHSGVPLAPFGERSLGPNTTIGRFLRSAQTWPGLEATLGGDAYAELARALTDVLCASNVLATVSANAHAGFQIRAGALLWRPGDGTVQRDPVRTRRMNLPQSTPPPQPNSFFADFYREVAEKLGSTEGREHTGQVRQSDREDREQRFREGKLAALFCSPTMELGIDIADLNVVHLRNVPPTPANYAQRSGRAGRSGQPALIATYCSVGSGHDQAYFRKPVTMVAGKVVAPRFDLANQDLVRAHIHALWLSATELSLGRSLIELLDTADAAGNYPLRAAVTQALQLGAPQRAACISAGNHVLATLASELQASSWFDADWVARQIAAAPASFNAACERWRDLYLAAERQLTEARADIDRRYLGKADREATEDARRREREALRQKDLLCNTGRADESDFYPYRYFAAEGFLPGYNFPRLPVRAFLPTSSDDGAFIDRPRFLALTEFGPRNIIYHEGRKYRVTRAMLPAGGAAARLATAKLCNCCGYIHEGPTVASLSYCERCATLLDAKNSLTTDRLFEMAPVAAQRAERITSDEEERTRQGYHVTAHFRFPSEAGAPRAVGAVAADTAGALLALTYAPTATLWRVNHRWRRSRTDGFTLDLQRGVWAKRPDDDADGGSDGPAGQLLHGVRVYVRDTRNLLLIQPAAHTTPATLASIQFALQRGIEAVFQVEEQELSSIRVGEDANASILFWEASEGGAGVLSRLVDEPGALATVARAALAICHFDPADTSGRADSCGRACYHCLLAYSNQADHALLDRYLVRELLTRLAHATTRTERAADAARDGTIGGFAGEVLARLRALGRRAPDALRPTLADGAAVPDLYYALSSGPLCVFCDATPPDATARAARDDLDDRGYRVLAIRADAALDAQLEHLP